MKLKISYKANSILHLNECWPVRREGFEVNFNLKENKVTGISVEFKIDKSQMPTIIENLDSRSRIAASINIPDIENLRRARSFIRRIQSFVSSMAPTDIDFKSETLEWIPENEQERQELKLFKFSFSSQGTRYDSPLELTYDFIAALTYHAYSAVPQEIALSFVHNGNEDYNDGKFISAFYNFFFSLETQFFAGYSDPKKVKAKIKECREVRAALVDLREALLFQTRGSLSKFTKMADKTDDELIDYIVDVRGRLHHHASKGPASWHPDEQEEYEAEAFVLKVLASSVANTFVLGSVYSIENGDDFFQECEAVKAIVTVIVKGVETTRQGRNREFELLMRIPSLKPHAALIESLNNRLREQLSKHECVPLNYQMRTPDGQILAIYERSEQF